MPSVWEYALPRRFAKVFAIIIVGTAIAYSSMIFQTITNNRILTPSILGLDSLYVLLQTGIIFFFGAAKLADLGKNGNFLLSTGLMVCFSFVLFFLMFRRGGRHIFLLLLVGIVFGTLFRSLSSFMQMLIDPNEFQVVQNKMFASFNNLNTLKSSGEEIDRLEKRRRQFITDVSHELKTPLILKQAFHEFTRFLRRVGY